MDFANLDTASSVILLLVGLGVFLLGFKFLGDSIEKLSASKLRALFNRAAGNRFAGVGVGALATAIVQSSSAVTSVLVVMASTTPPLLVGGGGNGILFVILGTNIGTCVTAVLSSIGANTNAKRACLYHLLFNVIGSIIFLIVLWIWDDFYDLLFGLFGGSANASEEVIVAANTTCITFFHTMFNVICTCLYLPFIKYLVRLTELIIPDRKKARRNRSDEGFMDKRLLVTPSLALGQLVKQTTYTAGIAVKCLNNAVAGFIAKDDSKLDDMVKDVQKVNDLSQEITGYLIEISAKDISLSDEKLVNVLHRDNSDIVRIADIAENIVGYTHKAIDETLVFSDVVKRDLNKLMKLLNEQYELVVDIVENNNIVKIKQSDELEQEIDASKKRLLDEHIERMARGECNAENNSLFVSLISNLERVGDHLSMMAHSVEEVV